ncbi:MAG: hypothetical protein COV08_03285 [Candidatus Vogelbacteria bacterium CG10_big_fil_rev_8_21_14_0_10_49_38]|uniref:Uncharacterized protein n=1 Tax=Candidatus Vogelbacteria bacterium CG10_big_fil_rev_8_21_14_0_10_49_38 TaxID=1975043 RepID=A0A2H0RGY1_9BACT|nr:MAG: hypothetical protein BK006_03285 [bacterium CG10_49_38]PIR45768.1 MAG: hypothetical protein COV08_03285 [Candidatus Vogelbacteria bacterium CG10_big_fil_rev_8_21_14_0_10_49_38]
MIKNKMKRFLTLAGLHIFTLGLLVWPIGGKLLAETGPVDSGGVLQNPLKADTFLELLDLLLGAVVQVGLVVVTFFIIYAGFLFVKAQGSPDGLKNAKGAIKWTIIGSAIVLGAYAIKEIIYNTVSGLTTGL